MKIGDVVENFQLKDQDGNDFDLYENLDKDVLLVFYPKDNTPVCTSQLVDYSLNKIELEKHGIKIIGVNIADIESHNNFCTNNKIDFPVLSDNEKKVSRQFDALNLLGQNKRKLVLIGKNKKIKFERSTLSVFFVDTTQLLFELGKTKLI
ncbi:MAG: redoxin domain-containing protein [Ignavibacteriaceae bacterium]|nr:redoxin domain-containing protein [Ignavibacterium sp.]MCC6253932.1 redoxin domain-containing protein [Ignavibacteriaceae bacterium]HRN25279.1 peroxiredoxin family protein [Ignavibacteriaceae bacterium]HRP92375.1 peroxiredoxin family protein [Ignavibacteriaceae bacterium]HRQ52870.1 peroxiredoxin family protein [Ignavibacteriaceae bacterium]